MRDPGLRENRRAELQVGILVIVSLLVLILGVFWLSNTRVLDRGLRVFGTAADAGQITSGARIFLLGVDVGSVNRVMLEEDRVVLAMGIDYEGRLPADTRGLIQPAGFLGQQMVTLLPGTAAEPLADGDTIALDRIPGLQALVGDLGDQASVVLERTTYLLSEETVDGVREGTEALASTMRELRQVVREERATLDELLGNLEATSAQLSEATAGPELERAVSRLDSLTARFSRAAGELDSASGSLASILDKMDRGTGTLGRLVNDEALYDQAAAAMENLQAASEEIALLSQDLRQNPERYLRGLKFSVF